MRFYTNIFKFSFLALLSLLLYACSTNEVAEGVDIPEVNDTPENSAVVTMDGFYPGDEVTRASLSYGSNGLSFSWEKNDLFGIFPTSYIENGVLKQNDNASQIPFSLYKVEENVQNARIVSDNRGFNFVDTYKYTAYTQYLSNAINHKAIPFDFSDQTQIGYVNMGAYYKTGGGGYNNADYKASEALACSHLSSKDVLISPEITIENDEAFFRMRHIGAVARCFIKTTPGRKLKIKELKLIADKDIFYTKGFINLTSHPYDATAVPSTSVPTIPEKVKNYGVTLPQAYDTDNEGNKTCQISPDESSRTNCLTLKFATKSNDGTYSEGINNLAGTDTTYGGYILAYMMMYPINYDNTQASAFIYVTADDENGNEVYYRTSKKLASKYMCSGYVYQWTNTPDDIHPIELTATLLPWQDIVADGINTDLEK